MSASIDDEVEWDIDLSDPVNGSHPLNRGRIAWWMALPGLDGGRQLYDLMGLYPGTLTNMASASGWRGTIRPSGYRHLLFDGTDDHVDLPDVRNSFGSTCTVAAWVNMTAAGSYPMIFSAYKSVEGMELRAEASAGTPSFIVTVPGSIGAVSSTNIVGTGWRRLVGTYDGAVARIYIDGIFGGSVSSSGSLNFGTAGATWRIGDRGTSGGFPFTGQIDDVSLLNRAWSAAEVRADYDLSRQGYPGVLNRFAPLLSGAVGAAPPATLYPFVGDETSFAGYVEG